ncbi:MAG: thiamine-phosphate kinase [Thermomicrobiales bacterium]
MARIDRLLAKGTDVRHGETVADIGEFALIERLTQALPSTVRRAGIDLGIGDDAAVWEPTPGTVSVITTDTLIETVHFRLDWTDWRSLGFKALAVNLSDIAAMGATPRLATITLGLRGTERVADLVTMYEGIGELAEAHRVAIAGGDIVRSPGGLAIGVTAIGETARDRLLRRSGAREGDVIAVSGTIGASAAGWRILAEPDRFGGMTTTGLLVSAHLQPIPRIALGKVLGDLGVMAAMDLSDGLLGDLPKILAASGVGATIDARMLPVAPAVRALFPDTWLDLALRGGEDYELLFTAPPARFDEIVRRAEGIGSAVTAIGTVESASHGLVVRGLDGKERSAVAGTLWDHFSGA